jgi:hypothetical protein
MVSTYLAARIARDGTIEPKALTMRSPPQALGVPQRNRPDLAFLASENDGRVRSRAR